MRLFGHYIAVFIVLVLANVSSAQESNQPLQKQDQTAQEQYQTVQNEGRNEGPGAIPPPEVQNQSAIDRARPNLSNAYAVESYLDGVVESFMEDENIAGVTVSIVHDGQIVLEKGYGHASFDPPEAVEPDTTMFRIGSISKTFTWTSLMQLAEQGRLSLNDPVNDHLPDSLKFHQEAGEEPVRIRHLMSHSPGLEDTTLGHLFFANEQEMPERLAYFQKYRPAQVRRPGQIASYSNYGAGLAGLIVEQVTGQTYESYVEDQILRPLGMDRTSFREPTEIGRDGAMPEALARNLSTGFTYEQGGFKAHGFEYIGHIAPAGSASSTASDMARYMLAHLGEGEFDGARILEPGTVSTMRDTLLANAPGVQGLSHGFMQYRPGGYSAYGHAGGTLYFLSNMVLVPELEFGVFISTNTPTSQPLIVDLPGLLVERFFSPKVGQAPKPPADFAERADRFTGTYLSTRRSYTSLEKLFLALPSGIVRVTAHPDGYLLTNDALGTTRWVQVGPLSFREVGGYSHLGFVENDDGEIAYLSYDAGVTAAEKVGFFATPNWLIIVTVLVVLASVGAIVGGWLRRGRDISQSRHERHSGRLMPLLGVAWLAFVGIFAVALGAMASQGSQVIFSYPSTLLIVSLVAALVASALTIIAVFTLYPVWTDRSWPVWRRVRHSVVVLISVAYLLTLNWWNIIGFQYY